jgi:hypothetical protein
VGRGEKDSVAAKGTRESIRDEMNVLHHAKCKIW